MMSLNKEEIGLIRKYLDFKELTQVDLRNEVLDHMATNIENTMLAEDLSFKKAFEEEKFSWKNELKDHSSFWLGFAWVGPKIMIKKCAKEVKHMYLTSFNLALFLYFIYNILNQFEIPITHIREGLGVTYLAYFVFILFGFFRMKASNFDSTYRHLYKINAIGWGFAYIAFNPIFSNSLDIVINSLSNPILLLSLHSILLVFGYQFFSLYRKHFKCKNHVLV